MAITKIWTVKSRLDSSLKYIANPDKTSIQPDIDAVEGVMKYIKNGDKTEQCKYVKAYNCTTDKAFSEMLETQELFGKAVEKTVYSPIIWCNHSRILKPHPKLLTGADRSLSNGYLRINTKPSLQRILTINTCTTTSL